MADESSVAAGKRFARDMKRIREDRGFSVEDLHKETRIARSLIQSFEEGGLYDHSTFNEVYLRSFVRAYAEALDISPDAALDGLEAALNEGYEDQLAQAYLQSPSSGDEEGAAHPSEEDAPGAPDRSPPRAPVAGGPEGRGGLVGPPRALGEEGPSIGEDDPPPDADASEAAPPDSPTSSAEGPPSSEEPSSPEEAPSPASEEASASAPSPDGPSSEASSGAPSSAAAPEEEETASTDEQRAGDGGDGEAAEDAADEDDEALDVRPAWMDDDPADGDDGAPPSTAPPASEAGDPDAAPSPPIGEGGDTGIVGEPTALGEGGGEQASPQPSGSASPAAGPAGPPGRDQSRWRRFLGGERQEMLWAGLGIAVVIVVLVGLGIAFFSSGDAPSDAPSRASEAATDTAATASAPDTTTTPDAPPPANVTLGPSIPLTVLATDNVSGIRIRRDDDLRRPYWIGEGEAQVFPFEQRVTIQDELTDVRLFLAGYPYPVSPTDTAAVLEITRSQAEAFVDTLRGAPATLSVSPDTIPVGDPQE